MRCNCAFERLNNTYIIVDYCWLSGYVRFITLMARVLLLGEQGQGQLRSNLTGYNVMTRMYVASLGYNIQWCVTQPNLTQ